MGIHADYCLICARRRRAGEYSCPRCGSDCYGDVLPGQGPVHEGEAAQPLGGLLGEMINLPAGALVLCYGGKGGGKTTVALGAFPNGIFGTTEMSPENVRAYARRLGVQLGQVVVPRLTQDEFGPRVDLRASGACDYVLDSLNGTKAPAVALAACRELCDQGGRAIALAQITQDDRVRGGEDLPHDADVVIHFERHAGQTRVTVEKNRFGEESSRTIALGEEGVRGLPRDRYYSVEGQGPHYRLEPWPSSSAKHAALLAEAEKVAAEGLLTALPPPPVAVTALRSALYPGGWIEPVDLAARKAYAQGAGIPHYSPVRRP